MCTQYTYGPIVIDFSVRIFLSVFSVRFLFLISLISRTSAAIRRVYRHHSRRRRTDASLLGTETESTFLRISRAVTAEARVRDLRHERIHLLSIVQ